MDVQCPWRLLSPPGRPAAPPPPLIGQVYLPTPLLVSSMNANFMPPHWAPADRPVVTSAAPEGVLAGGEHAAPLCSVRPSWEWELRTSVVPSAGFSPPAPPADPKALVVHRGGCHCGAVRIEVDAPSHLVAYDCNCSDCRMRRNVHFVVPKERLRFVRDEFGGEAGAAGLAEYRWGTGAARHLFCARCGITPLYVPRSNPDGWAVTLQCIDGGTCASVEVRHFDGLHWEEFIAGEGASIRSFSVAEKES